MEKEVYHDYFENEHWHVIYDGSNYSIEAIAFKRKEDNSWDVYFNNWRTLEECETISKEKAYYKDETFGLLIFNEQEDKVFERFVKWIEEKLMPIRQGK